MLVYSFTYHKMLFHLIIKFTVFSVHSLIIVFNEFIDILTNLFIMYPRHFIIYIYIY